MAWTVPSPLCQAQGHPPCCGAGQSCSTQQLTLTWTQGLGGQGLGKQQLAQGKSREIPASATTWISLVLLGKLAIPKTLAPLFSYKSLLRMLPHSCHCCHPPSPQVRGEPGHKPWSCPRAVSKLKESWDDAHHGGHTKSRALADPAPVLLPSSALSTRAHPPAFLLSAHCFNPYNYFIKPPHFTHSAASPRETSGNSPTAPQGKKRKVNNSLKD